MPLDATASSNSAASAASFTDVDVALVMLGHALRLQGYSFSAVTAATHARHRARFGVEARATSLRDIFGWNLPFARADFPTVAEHLDAAGLAIAVACADEDGDDVDLVRSAVSFCTVDGEIVAHGLAGLVGGAGHLTPDTVRASRVVRERLLSSSSSSSASSSSSSSSSVLVRRAGCGLVGLHLATTNAEVVLVDDNIEAQRLCRINAALAGVEVDVVDAASGTFDVVVVEAGTLEETIVIVEDVLTMLAPGGRLLVTTRTPILDGVDVFRERMRSLLVGRAFAYDEIEADVGGDVDDGSERVAFCVLDLVVPKLQAVVAAPAVAVDGDFI